MSFKIRSLTSQDYIPADFNELHTSLQPKLNFLHLTKTHPYIEVNPTKLSGIWV